MTRKRQILLAILLLCGATACIRENIDDCETPVTLDFRYFGDGIVDMFSDRIKTVELFVYRADGELVQTVSCTESELDAQCVQLRLLEGDYRIVCWGNAWENTHLEAEADEPYLGESSWFDGEDCQGIDPLYFGETEIIVPRTLKPVRDTIIYNCSHISIAVNLIGFANADNFYTASSSDISRATRSDDTEDALVTLYHEDLSAHISFENTPGSTLTDYLPELSPHTEYDDSYLAFYRVPKFLNSTGSSLVIKRNDTGAELYRRPFADILDDLGIDVESRDELSLELSIRVWSINGEVHIEIVGWNTEIIFPIA